MKLTNAEIGNLISALDLAIEYRKSDLWSHTPAISIGDKDIVTEAREDIKLLRPLRKKLHEHEQNALKHLSKGQKR